MGKLKDHIERDDHGIAEWIKRKFQNHDPMSARDAGLGKPNGKRVVHMEGTSEVFYRSGNNRTFKIEVVEITDTEEADMVGMLALED